MTGASSREEWWSHDATNTLIQAWGSLYLDLNRGNLRSTHWRQVADAVNLRHRHVTDVQCKNRIDTLKKKYKIERARVSPPSQWPFFNPLHRLIANTFNTNKKKNHRKIDESSPEPESPEPESESEPESPPVRPLSWSVPVGPRSKRPAASPADDSSYFLRDQAEEEGSRSSGAASRRMGKRKRKRRSNEGFSGLGELARAVERFGEIYERVEGAKQRQAVELEKQRMQFARDLEYQRMQLFADTQLELHKAKREPDTYS